MSGRAPRTTSDATIPVHDGTSASVFVILFGTRTKTFSYRPTRALGVEPTGFGLPATSKERGAGVRRALRSGYFTDFEQRRIGHASKEDQIQLRTVGQPVELKIIWKHQARGTREKERKKEREKYLKTFTMNMEIRTLGVEPRISRFDVHARPKSSGRTPRTTSEIPGCFEGMVKNARVDWVWKGWSRLLCMREVETRSHGPSDSRNGPINNEEKIQSLVPFGRWESNPGLPLESTWDLFHKAQVAEGGNSGCARSNIERIELRGSQICLYRTSRHNKKNALRKQH
ncbi:hypothetical protein C8R43DRAFT_962332 [Mycena crocata]|nr:hypothetical protein C8R43DRAFT_962332 [Mycena crocata]